MTEKTQGQSPDLVALAGDIVSAYIANNSVPVADLPALIGNVHTALQKISSGSTAGTASAEAEPVEQPTAAQIRKSLAQDGLISFVDGKSYKTLKRHLSKHGLDPRSYRDRYGLPADYPMTAPAYSAARSALAKNNGLGKPGRFAA